MKKTYLYIIIICIVFYLLYKKNKETFNSVPYNAFIVPENKIKTTYEEDTLLLDNNFYLYINKGKELPDYKNVFIKYPYYSTFPYNDVLKNIVLKEINRILLQTNHFKDTKFEMFGDLTNVYWKDINLDRHLIFNIDVVNKEKVFVRKLLVYLIINNIKQYLSDTNEYIPIALIENLNYTIEYIEVDKEFVYKPINSINEVLYKDDNYHNFYQIKNTLYLTEPYITSKNDVDINYIHKLDFQKKLKVPSGIELKNVITGKCYNSTGVSKEQCLNNGGTWDVIPKDDTNCPFYRSNKNYPNSFGKLIGEQCELPLNMQLLGNTQYSKDPIYNPLCYNCIDNKIGNGTLGFCCDEQNNKTKYPKLLSPDYAFKNDIDIRNKYKDVFLTNNLSIN